MISPLSTAVAGAAVSLVDKESDLFRFTLKHSILFAALVGVSCPPAGLRFQENDSVSA